MPFPTKRNRPPGQVRIFAVWAIVGLLAAIPGRSGHAQDRRDLGSYERDALAKGLERGHWTLDLAPQGKRIGKIHIINLDVFGADTGRLQALNHLHYTTREWAIRRELLVQPGEWWDDERILESERIVRDPTVSSLVVMIPVQAAQDGIVDVLVVTRDVWSLRTNSEFIYQEGRLTYLTVAAAENNLLGMRKHVSLILEMDQGEYSISPRWRDPNIKGTRWQLRVRPRVLFGRATNKVEGTQSLTTIDYPLWSLDSNWGFSFEARHKTGIARTFKGSALATYDNPDTANIEAIPQEFRRRELAVTTSTSRSFRGSYKHTFSAGHELLFSRPRVLDDQGLPDELAQAFARDLFPRDERSSAGTLGYDFFQPRFVTYRNIASFDLPEVRIAGPRASVNAALALRAFGSEQTFFRHRLRAGYLFDFDAEAFIDIGITTARRHELGNRFLPAVDVEYGVNWFAASPVLPGSVRLVTYGDSTLTIDSEENTIIQLGGQRNLRGYALGSFTGTSFARASVEVRSLPHELAFARVGYLAFWDAGDAANHPGDLRPHHDLGLGLKALVPQTGESLFFFYWAVPLDAEPGRFPGRFSLGFEGDI